MSTVAAYAAMSATEPLTEDHDHPSRPGPARRGDRHQVRRNLSLGHPYRQSRVGPTELPCGPWPRDRRRGDRRGLGGDQVPAGRPRWGWLFRGLVPRVQQLHARHRTVLQAGRKLHLQLDRQRRPANPGRLQRSDRRRRKLRVAHTRRAALDVAAPLLCAGITLYSPLRHWNAGANTRVAIIGLGGLGHMGVKLGAAMGADVTVLSQSLKKMEDGLRLGPRATTRPPTRTPSASCAAAST